MAIQHNQELKEHLNPNSLAKSTDFKNQIITAKRNKHYLPD